MNLRLLTLVLLTQFSFFAARAQRAIIWQTDSSLHLGGQVPFDRVTIEDVRHDRIAIGRLRTGLGARHSNLVMNDSVSKSLSAYATGLLQGSTTSPGELLVVLRDFRVEDYEGADEIGTVHVHADLLFSGVTNGQYTHLRIFDTLLETKSRRDLTAEVQRLASQAVLELVRAGATAAPSPSGLHTRTSAILREERAKEAYPLYSVPNPPRGLYHSIDDLLHLRTTDTAFIDLKVLSADAPPIWYFYRKNSTGKKGESIKPKDCFAIYDGKQWHISNTIRFERFKQEDGDFYTSILLNGLVSDRSLWLSLNGIPVARIAAGDRGLQPVPYRVRLDPEAGRFLPVKRGR